MTTAQKKWLVERLRETGCIVDDDFPGLKQLNVKEQFYVLRMGVWFKIKVSHILKHWDERMKKQAEHFYYLSDFLDEFIGDFEQRRAS